MFPVLTLFSYWRLFRPIFSVERLTRAGNKNRVVAGEGDGWIGRHQVALSLSLSEKQKEKLTAEGKDFKCKSDGP